MYLLSQYRKFDFCFFLMGKQLATFLVKIFLCSSMSAFLSLVPSRYRASWTTLRKRPLYISFCPWALCLRLLQTRFMSRGWRLPSRNVLGSLAVHWFISSLCASAFSPSNVQNFCLLPLPWPLLPLAFIPLFLPFASSQQGALLHVLQLVVSMMSSRRRCWAVNCEGGVDQALVPRCWLLSSHRLAFSEENPV